MLYVSFPLCVCVTVSVCVCARACAGWCNVCVMCANRFVLVHFADTFLTESLGPKFSDSQQQLLCRVFILFYVVPHPTIALTKLVLERGHQNVKYAQRSFWTQQQPKEESARCLTPMYDVRSNSGVHSLEIINKIAENCEIVQLCTLAPTDGSPRL